MARLFKVQGSDLVEVQRHALADERTLESWIEHDPGIIGRELLLIGRQVRTDYGGYIDLLGMDSEGSIVVVELKRGMTPREVVAQILDYASWVNELTTADIREIFARYSSTPLEQAFREKFGTAMPESLNKSHGLVIVASRFDASSERIVRYLATVHELDINTAFFDVFEEKGQTLVSTNLLLDQEEVSERSRSRKRAPWTGFWYVNVMEGASRSWEDMRKYGFVASGNGRIYSEPLQKLAIGDQIFAYHKRYGYVGHGVVRDTAVMVRDFQTASGPLSEQQLKQANLFHDKDDPERAEYAVAVNWSKTFALSDAKTFDGVFANQNIVCKLTHPATLDFVKQVFGVASDPIDLGR